MQTFLLVFSRFYTHKNDVQRNPWWCFWATQVFVEQSEFHFSQSGYSLSLCLLINVIWKMLASIICSGANLFFLTQKYLLKTPPCSDSTYVECRNECSSWFDWRLLEIRLIIILQNNWLCAENTLWVIYRPQMIVPSEITFSRYNLLDQWAFTIEFYRLKLIDLYYCLYVVDYDIFVLYENRVKKIVKFRWLNICRGIV